MDKELEIVKLVFHQDKDEIIKKYLATGAGIGKEDEKYVIVVYNKQKTFPSRKKQYWKNIPLIFRDIGEIKLQ